MHVLILTPFYPPLVSGAGAHVADIAEGLVAAGHRVTVLFGQGADGTTIVNGVKVEGAHSPVPLASSLWMMVRGLRTHHRDRLDLVIAGLAHPTGLVALLVAALCRRPLAIVAHGEEVAVGRTSRLARYCLRVVLGGNRTVLAVSSYTRGEVIAMGGSPAHCFIVPPGIDPAPVTTGSTMRTEFRQRFGLTEAPVVLTVARLEARKGQDVVLEAVHLLSGYPTLQYVVVGQGDAASLRKTSAEWNMGDRVTVIEYLTPAELPHAYAAADVFAMASRPGAEGEVDGFGIVYLEAADAGLPCVAGNLGGCPDAVADGITGWCVDPRDPSAVAAALKSLLDDPDRARRMGHAGQRRVAEQFTRKVLRTTSTGLLESLARHRRRPRGQS
ncbi:MAG: glycosyltransferase family 4 protein [Ilumatobacteraceae bacterium]